MSKIGNTTDYVVTAPALDDMVIGTDVSNTVSDPTGETVNFMWSGVRTLFGISENYTFPSADGTANQVLTTDGSGAVTFADAGGGGSALELYAENPDSPTDPSVIGNNAVAIGTASVASGDTAIAVGPSAQATGYYSSAFGFSARAAGSTSVALGKSRAGGISSLSALIDSTASTYGSTGSYSFALGRFAKATATQSIAIGDAAISETANLIALGGTDDTVQISGTYTLPTADGTANQVLTTDGSGAVTFADAGGGGGGALELYAENPVSPTAPVATGANAVAIGRNSAATNDRSIALGSNSNASALFSTAVGYNNAASATGATAVGVNSSAGGGYSLAFNGSAGSTSSSAIGHNSGTGKATTATGSGAMALGGSYASGTDSFAAAIASNSGSYGATGANSIAMGKTAKSSSNNSISIGHNSQATSIYAVALGIAAKATNTSAVCISGFNSLASGDTSSVLGGGRQTASGEFSTVLGGEHNTASGGFSIACGTRAVSSTYGKVAHATGRFSSDGDAQSGEFVLRSDTTDATPEALTTDNSGADDNNQIILPNNSAFAFHGTIVARQQASGGTACAAWKVEGLIRREANAGTTVLVNSATTILDNTPAWGMALSADTTNGGLKIEVTGEAATNIRWVATINTTEVTY
jgi:hypothetical protein